MSSEARAGDSEGRREDVCCLCNRSDIQAMAAMVAVTAREGSADGSVTAPPLLVWLEKEELFCG